MMAKRFFVLYRETSNEEEETILFSPFPGHKELTGTEEDIQTLMKENPDRDIFVIYGERVPLKVEERPRTFEVVFGKDPREKK